MEETSDSSPRKPRKVLFLDVDGVLNNAYTKERCLTWKGVDKKLAKTFVDWWHKHPDVDIVLSSSWRKDPAMWFALHAEGIHWIDTTKDSKGFLSRSDEISVWLDKHPSVIQYAILDDADCADHGDAYVPTIEEVGLTPEEIEELESIFHDDMG